MLLAWSAADVRAAEQPLLTAGAPLMARASAGLAAACALLLRQRRGRLVGARVLVLAGPGGNGGDALHAGALLARRGAVVRAAQLLGDPHGEGLAALRRAGGRWQPGLPDDLGRRPPALVLDGVLGIGARPGLPGDVAAALRRVAALGVSPDSGPDAATRRPLVVAVDLPSGLSADDGALAEATLPADLVVTFGAAKPGLLLPPGERAVRRLEVVDIGLDLPGRPALVRLEAADVAAAWPVPPRDADKYRRGVVGVVAGSAGYTGAAVLAVEGAVRAGAGMVRYVGPDHPTELVRQRRPEVVPGGGRVQAWVLGPGVEPDDEAQGAHVRAGLASGLPCVVDAGALAHLPDRVGEHVVLTPHAGELARLLADRTGEAVHRDAVEAQPLRHARRAAETTGATVLLKGATTVVVPPPGSAAPVVSQADGPAWLATAGAGDVLAGVLGAVLASPDGMPSPALRAGLAALVHGRAAALASGGGPVAALDVADAVPRAVAALRRPAETMEGT